MDSYRGTVAGLEWSASDTHLRDNDAGDDEIGREPPPAGFDQQERRMQLRACNHWASLLGDRNFPRIEDLAPAAMPDFADHAVLLDFSQGTANPAVTMLGKRLREECGTAMTIAWLSDVPVGSLLSRMTDHYMQILASQAPISFEAEFINHHGKALVYRGILLPFSGDEGPIQHIMGVITWKELADPAMTAGLLRELDSAVGPAGLPVDTAAIEREGRLLLR